MQASAHVAVAGTAVTAADILASTLLHDPVLAALGLPVLAAWAWLLARTARNSEPYPTNTERRQP